MCFKYKNICRLKVNDRRKKRVQANSNHKKVKVAILISDNTDFTTKP